MSGFPVYSAWEAVYRAVKKSIYAEQVFCSITTQMASMQEFVGQRNLDAVHRENYETSYHRNTAAGNLIRLNHGGLDSTGSNRMLIVETVECFLLTREHDSKAESHFEALRAETAEGQRLLEMAGKWHERRKLWLKRAAKTMRSVISPDLWEEGAQKAKTR